MTTRWLRRQEAATYLGVSPKTLDRYVRDGKIKKFTIDGLSTPRFRQQDLDSLVAPASDEADEGNPDAA